VLRIVETRDGLGERQGLRQERFAEIENGARWHRVVQLPRDLLRILNARRIVVRELEHWFSPR
jgi:hypothetical protein